MKIFVTGGAGFIGSHVAETYLRKGHEVVILDDLSSGSKENLPPNCRLYPLSLTDPKVSEIIAQERPEVLNHHAAQIDVRRSVADPVYDAKVNILGTLNLLEACRRHGVKKVVFASTGGALYGNQIHFPADEKHPTDPQSPYGITKLAVEKYLQFYSWTYGVSFVSLRYANVYGPRQNARGEAGVVAIFTERLLKGEPPMIFGDGRQTRDYVFVDDVVACNLAALDPDVQGIFHVGTGIETDVQTLARELIWITGRDPAPIYDPPRPGEQRRSSLKPGALQKLPPTPLSEGLRKTVEWFRRIQGERGRK